MTLVDIKTEASNPIPDPILIGMPAAGKSTVGVLLAKRLRKPFLDTDILIQNGEKAYLREILLRNGFEGFRRIEERYLLDIPKGCGVVATGGSAVYSSKAMGHLKAIGCVVYLAIGLESLKTRLDNLVERGVLILPGQTIDMLYDERCPLYERYADWTIDTTEKSPDQVAAMIATFLNDGTATI